ncbi:MAG: hypothetical protein ACLSV2_08595 [Clostridium sp.]
MKFYEFRNYEYYALIGADSKEDAIKEYERKIADIMEDEKEKKPVELTEKQVKNKYINALRNESESKEKVLKDFEVCRGEYNPCLLLIDGCLA